MAALPGIEPVSRESTATVIARQLREAIMNGVLPPGTQLGETDLAARFQVSRGPLREAMQHLVSEGLLRSERHRGLFVIDLEPTDVYDIYLARTAVERTALLRVLRGGDREEAATALEQAVAEMAAAAGDDDPSALSTADLRFHEALIEASGSKRLIRMARTLLIETRMCLTLLQSTYQRVEERVDEHTRIIEALRAGDEVTALGLLDAHMEDAISRLVPGTSLHNGGPPAKA
ncbi:DNA-binding GntR family transcriptional regulator [Amycolatopsis sulphurea]|uniref:DNA-binding GntR family transcriptional regulator n=1 Tax=Amycolatopsis sulphurea TaxID=76022 RepID=A0A2A9FEK0_9PSEU|nr:GntR family transcriptional regulator [Amycolatopsis sulphurea]PFG49588.1 DNA-binding GntR family transcriptional regulator [Amycolatopsis sulphurea]